MRIREGQAGWVEVGEVPGIEGRLYLRLALDGGKWAVRELYLDSEKPITAATLSRVPLGPTELLINADPDYLASRAHDPGPDLSTLATYFATFLPRQIDHWVALSMHAQREDSPVRRPRKLPKPSPKAQQERPPLVAPERLDEAFFTSLARAYVDVVNRGQRPAPVLADEAGVSPRTVHRWVLEARKRGYLPKGTQGRAGV